MRSAIYIFSTVLMLSGCASGGKGAQNTWEATSQADPVTGVERCVVTAPDRLFGSYTSSARLYPFVERNSEAGLLVGVSTGGKVRYPPGDIVWRVDQNEPRRITMAETPVIGEPASMLAPDSLDEAQRKVYDDAMKMSAGMTSSIQNGITAVGGEEAEVVLAEMRAGETLLFRAAAAAPNAGIPSSSVYDVGQRRNGESLPILLDASFDAALAECGL